MDLKNRRWKCDTQFLPSLWCCNSSTSNCYSQPFKWTCIEICIYRKLAKWKGLIYWFTIIYWLETTMIWCRSAMCNVHACTYRTQVNNHVIIVYICIIRTSNKLQRYSEPHLHYEIHLLFSGELFQSRNRFYLRCMQQDKSECRLRIFDAYGIIVYMELEMSVGRGQWFKRNTFFLSMSECNSMFAGSIYNLHNYLLF